MCTHAKDPGYGRSSSSASIKKKKSGTKVMTYQAQDNRPTALKGRVVGKRLIVYIIIFLFIIFSLPK